MFEGSNFPKVGKKEIREETARCNYRIRFDSNGQNRK